MTAAQVESASPARRGEAVTNRGVFAFVRAVALGLKSAAPELSAVSVVFDH
jgi:hypothetical protein